MVLGGVQADRAAGAFVGLAVGDALGAGYEFGEPPDQGTAEMIGGGLGGWEPGEWTDDTQLAVCIAKVAAGGVLDVAAAGEQFLAWYRSGPADVGIQTSTVLSGAASADDLPACADRYFGSHPDRSAGNGSLMRTAPVALALLGDDQTIAHAARAVSELTHADPLAGDACVLWCIAIDRAVREGRLDGIIDGLAFLPDQNQQPWARRIDQALAEPPRSFTPNGFVVTALQAALAAVSQTPVPADVPALHFQHGLQAAVATGDDTDTVAAIAGALLGARWGLSAIPYAARRILHGWPGMRARDLARLALLTAGCQDEKRGWPDAATMVPYYRRKFGLTPLELALRDAPGVLVGNVAALPGTDAEAIVSLCSIGPQDPPEDAEVDDVWLLDSADLTDNPNLGFVLADIADTIARFRADGRTVLVHCVAGESRTPAAAAAYLVRHLGMQPQAAFDELDHVLPITHIQPPLKAAVSRLARANQAQPN
jgi:ADP-ribosylglycohydrolase